MNAQQALTELTDIVRPMVHSIEASVPTTQNHYGDYMAAIAKVADAMHVRSTNGILAIGLAFGRAGADRDGVKSALRALGHL